MLRPDVEVLALNHLLAHEPRNWRWLLGNNSPVKSKVHQSIRLHFQTFFGFKDVGSIGFHLLLLRRAASENPQLENGIADWSGLEESCLIL